MKDKKKHPCKGKLSEKNHVRRVAQKKVPHARKNIPAREMLTKKIVQLKNPPPPPPRKDLSNGPSHGKIYNNMNN